MPKKTRRQKIRAKDRRPKLSLNLLSNEKAAKPVVSAISPSDKKIEISPVQEPKSEKMLFAQSKEEVKNFKADLGKSLFITVILIVIQLALYYADKNNYLDLASIIKY